MSCCSKHSYFDLVILVPMHKGNVINAYEVAGKSLLVRYEQGWSIMRETDGQGFKEVMGGFGGVTCRVVMGRFAAVHSSESLFVVDCLTLKMVQREVSAFGTVWSSGSTIMCESDNIVLFFQVIEDGSDNFLKEFKQAEKEFFSYVCNKGKKVRFLRLFL